MNLACGLVGLPNVGKSTLFNAFTRAGAEVANYPFCTIEPHTGVVPVPDPRLDVLAGHIVSKEVVPATVKVVDIAGLVAGASRGEGLGNRFLGHVREAHAILHVVRCFADEQVAHVSGEVDPAGDIGVVETELVMADFETIQRAGEKASKRARIGGKAVARELDVLGRAEAVLARGDGLSKQAWDEADRAVLAELSPLTLKPVLYVANVGEDDPRGESPLAARVRDCARTRGAEVVALCARMEAELVELDTEDRAAFLEDFGLERTGLEVLVAAAFRLLGLATFYTANENQIRAWTIRRGTTAWEAAGVVHSDFQKHFIRADVFTVDLLAELGSEAGIRAAGRMRSEGRDYVLQPGEVVFFVAGRAS